MGDPRLEELWADRANWRMGAIYVCKDDPRVWVPKRPKWAGWTLNFAHSRARWIMVAILGVIALVAWALVAIPPTAHGAEPAPAVALPGVPDAAWDAAFTRTEGWTGGDADYSVDLRDGRTLWLFADSWVGSVRDGKHQPGTKMINNAICVHATPGSGEAPDAAAMEFITGPANEKGEATSWIKPDDGRGWYWPADSIVAGDRLILTLWQIDASGGGGAFGFKTIDGAVAVIDNPREPPRKWTPRQFHNPHVRPADHDKKVQEVQWGAAVIACPGDPSMVYIYGVRENGWNKQLLLARAPAASIEDFRGWRFRTADGWSQKVDDAATICDGVANEVRIQPVMRGGRTVWVLVHSEPMLGHHIFVRTADSPEGPWSARQPVFKVDITTKGYFTYAAKSHPHLAADGELLITYVINGGSLWQTLADASIYRPRFIRVPVEAIK